MIKKYTVTKIVFANNIKEVLDTERGDIIEISLHSEVDNGNGLGFTTNNGKREGN
mgnify:CR=1 FL=1